MMAERQWKPGDLARAFVTTRQRELTLVRVDRVLGMYTWEIAKGEPGEGGLLGDGALRDLRPLVVIDPGEDDPADLAESLRLLAQEAEDRFGWDKTGPAIRRLADQFALPRPTEPTGLGRSSQCDPGPVYDNAWAVRVQREGGAPWSWHDSSGNGGRRTWADLDVVEVLSEGVTA